MSRRQPYPRTLLTTTQLGEALGVSREYATILADRGDIAIYALSGTNAQRLFTTAEVERLRLERQAKRDTRAQRRLGVS